MRQGQNSKRSRGRGSNRRSFPTRHQTFDSNGPNVRIRGNAHQVHEKYLALARDAGSSGDRVAAENYLQHADHYFRLINLDSDDDGHGRSRHQSQGGYGPGRGGNGRAAEDEDRVGKEAAGRGEDVGAQDAEVAEQGASNGFGEQPAANADQQPSSIPGEGEQPVIPKRRGRPRRMSERANGTVDGNADGEATSSDEAAPAVPAKRRGRPRKAAAAPTPETPAED